MRFSSKYVFGHLCGLGASSVAPLSEAVPPGHLAMI